MKEDVIQLVFFYGLVYLRCLLSKIVFHVSFLIYIYYSGTLASFLQTKVYVSLTCLLLGSPCSAACVLFRDCFIIFFVWETIPVLLGSHALRDVMCL